jgi:hypothetical protein
VTAPNAAQIYAYLTGTLGFTQAGAAGAMGNLEVESDFNPNAYNANENAHGLAQWEGGRGTNLEAYESAHGGVTLANQLSFMAQELMSSYPTVLTAEQKATDPTAAAYEWDTVYEGSTAASIPQREANAQTIYDAIQNSTLTTTSAPSSLAGSTSGSSSSGGATATDTSVSSVLGDINDMMPWNWGSDLSSATGDVVSVIIAFVTKLAFVGLGLVLILLGVYEASKGTGQTAQNLGLIGAIAA